ncbi:MAG: 4-hydroxybenzoate octaprenyltransferase, partial [Polyangiaceae bacterium]
LVISAASHVVTVLAFVFAGWSLARGPLFFAGVTVTGLLLVWEHSIVGKGNLAKIDKAFFDLNAWVSVGFFVFCVCDELHRREVLS